MISHRSTTSKKPEKAKRTSTQRTNTRPIKISSAPKNTAFDRESGLVYDEVQIQGGKGSSTWIVDYKTPNIVRTRIRTNKTKGARKLSEMVLGKLGLEARELSVEALQSVPWSMGEKIWEKIRDNHAESYYVWRTFATAYGFEFAHSSNRYFLEIRNPSLQLTDYYTGLSSADQRWVTCIHLSPKQIAVPDLISVSTIPNLSILDLSDGQLYIENRESTFEMRVMRTWSELARSGRAFKNLRVLMLGWQEKVDTWIFDLLDGFPKLNILVLTDCHKIHHKNHKEWEQAAWKSRWTFLPSKRGVKYLRSLLNDKSAVGNMSNLYYESLEMIAAAGGSSATSQPRPLVECWLGTPKQWSHIIEEFPGTRTVFLQKEPKTSISTLSQKTIPENEPSPKISSAPKIAKREPSSPVSLVAPKRIQNLTGPQRKAPKHSAASLLTDMDLHGQS